MTGRPAPRLYGELAAWWPLLSPPSEYVEEAAELLAIAHDAVEGDLRTALELGSGGGSLASNLSSVLALTLTDISEAMLDVSRETNPGCEHALGDMRTIDLGREFDLVLIHDAIGYMTNEGALALAIANAARHCRARGAVILAPDDVAETFEPATQHGGYDADDGRGLRFLEWSWDPDPADTTIELELVLALREVGGEVRVEHDRHTLGLFTTETWIRAARAAGLEAEVRRDRWGRTLFVCRSPRSTGRRADPAQKQD